MRRLGSRFTLALVATTVFSLASQPLAAQSADETDGTALTATETVVSGAPVSSEEAAPAASERTLVSEDAARLGIAPVRSSEEAEARAQITDDPTMRWVIIIAIAAVAAALIIALAD